MKKIFIFSAYLLMVLTLAACGQASPVLKVMIQPEGSNVENYEYLVVYDNGETTATDSFTPDDAAFYTAESGAFISDVVNKKIVNTLGSTLLTDGHGNKTNADEMMTAIMQTAADSIDHDIIQFTIILDGDRYFTFVKLNVNLWSPCILYKYDTSTNRLIELCTWDGVNLMGIVVE